MLPNADSLDGWYYSSKSGTRVGPVTTSQLRYLVDSGVLEPATPVASNSAGAWLPASEAINPTTSSPPVEPSVANADDPFGPAFDSIRNLAGTRPLSGFSLRTMFSDVFKHHSDEEIDELLVVGGRSTTPPVEQVIGGWPRPWLFARCLLFLGAIYIAFLICARLFGSNTFLPGVIIMGSLAVPLSTLLLFFELNSPRNVSFARVLMLFCSGGIASLVTSVIGYSVSNLGWLGAMQAGIVEEAGKLLAVFILVRSVRFKYILNGLLFGAAVGAGFAAFESAGYAFAALGSHTGPSVTSVLSVRGLLAPFGHPAWTAIAAGALWRRKRDQAPELGMMFEPSVLKTVCIPVILHMLWNGPDFSMPVAKYLMIGAVGWYVVFSLLQQGIEQVTAEQVHTRRLKYRSVSGVART